MDKTIKNVKKVIDDGLELIDDLQRVRQKLKNANKFTITKHIGRNFVGDAFRGYKVSMVNKSIERAQEKILKFDSEVMRLQESLANNIDLPYKLTEFDSCRSKLKDITLRINMRKKQLDVENAIKQVKTVIRRLVFLKNKLEYENEKLKELEKQS
ncbi:MAG: hypothetical protein Q4B52_06125 [Tissierellia bacterium]|nr:hypothetical protein [Tissierellia bacterium]